MEAGPHGIETNRSHGVRDWEQQHGTDENAHHEFGDPNGLLPTYPLMRPKARAYSHRGHGPRADQKAGYISVKAFRLWLHHEIPHGLSNDAWMRDHGIVSGVFDSHNRQIFHVVS